MIKLLANEEVYGAVIEHGIGEAKHSVWIATANVKNLMLSIGGGEARSSLYLFEEMVERGIAVRLLHSGVPSGPFLKALKDHESKLAGRALFQMKRCIRTHSKCVLIDNKLLYVGSANFTGAGMGMKGKTRRNFELGVLTDEDEIMDRVTELFENIWSGRQCTRCGRREQCAVPLESPY
jgi:phosphatidylserine/phosphatidylglycerophosphate/cardiolipin synthase-like enzyme